MSIIQQHEHAKADQCKKESDDCVATPLLPPTVNVMYCIPLLLRHSCWRVADLF